MHPYSWIDTTAAWKKLRLILSDKSDFNMIDFLSIAVHAFASCTLMIFSVDEMLHSYLIQIIWTQLYGFKYSYLILMIIWFQVIISI